MAAFAASLAVLLLCCHAERPAFHARLAVDDAARGDCVKEGRCPLYTIHNVTIPSDSDVRYLIDRLEYSRETGLGKRVTYREGAIMKESMKLALLSYGRNEGKGLLYHAFQDQKGSLTHLELEMKSLRHVKGEVDDAAHMVVYLIRDYDKNRGIPDGFGVVLSYKGSTNAADWKSNMDSKSIPLFPDLPEEKETLVHRGFLGHKQRLDERMKHAPMAPLKALLKLWGVETDADNFRDFLFEAKWNWCFCTGHSLGGALAGISALDLAVRTKALRTRDQPVFAIGIASAIPGSKGFCQSMERYIQPHGGLRIENFGDVVTFLGYGKAALGRSKRTTFGFEWTLKESGFFKKFKKLAKHIQFDIDNGEGQITRFLFSSMGKTMVSNPEQIGSLKMTTLLEQD